MLAVADEPTGPYKEEFQIIPPWAHNPEAIITPDGTVAVTPLLLKDDRTPPQDSRSDL